MKQGMWWMGIIALILCLVGCSQTRDVSINEVVEAIVEDGINGMKEANRKELRRFIGLNPNEVEAVAYYIPASSMDVEELLIVKVSNQDQFDEIETLVEQRVMSQINRFSGYRPENCALLENYELKVRGDYLFFSVSKQVDELSDRFKDVMRK